MSDEIDQQEADKAIAFYSAIIRQQASAFLMAVADEINKSELCSIKQFKDGEIFHSEEFLTSPTDYYEIYIKDKMVFSTHRSKELSAIEINGLLNFLYNYPETVNASEHEKSLLEEYTYYYNDDSCLSTKL